MGAEVIRAALPGKRFRQLGLLSALALAHVACADSGAPPPPTTVRDSAGIRVTQTSARSVEAGPAFATVLDTLARIGSVTDQPGAEVFFNVAAARFLADGGLVVLHSGTELRFYDEEGGRTAITGGRGEGPGEYAEATGLRETPAGELVVWDARQARASFLSASGDFLRSRRIDRDGVAVLFPRLAGILPASRWHLLDEDRLLLFSYTFDDMPAEGTSRPRVHYVTVAFDGLRTDTLGEYRGVEQLVVPRSGGRVVIALDPDDVHFALAERTGRLYVGDSGEDRIDRFDAAGTMDLRIHLTDPTDRPQPHVVERAKERLHEQVQRWGLESMDDVVEQIAEAAAAPTFRSLVVDDMENLWVKWGVQPDPTRDMYAVFDAGGVLVGTLWLPAHDRVLDVRSGRVLVLHRSELDVETLAVYELRPGVAGP